MEHSPNSFSDLQTSLGNLGLLAFGTFQSDEVNPALLIGNAGQDMWNFFSTSDEYFDGKIDPLNRWTKKSLDKLATEYSAHAIYPFDKPFPPFQQFAQKAMGVKQSPIGLLIHPDYGLFHAFRGVMVFEPNSEVAIEAQAHFSELNVLIHPCDTCVEKPCLTTCPVSAFTGEGLDVTLCFSHLDSGEDPCCLISGCAARLSCPIGKNYRYSEEQIAFHMKAYRGR